MAGDVQIGGNLQASAGQDLAVIASTVKAGAMSAWRPSATSPSLRQPTRPAANTAAAQRQEINKEDSTIRQQAAVIEAGGDLDIEAGGNLLVSASKLKAGDEAYLYAGEQLA